jgi:hypothetical protein
MKKYHWYMLGPILLGIVLSIGVALSSDSIGDFCCKFPDIAPIIFGSMFLIIYITIVVIHNNIRLKKEIKIANERARLYEEKYHNLTNNMRHLELEKLEKLNLEPIIFLSHSSKDRAYADPIRNFIVGLGVKDEQLIYTSHVKHKIPFNIDVYPYLAEKIHDKCFMLIMWSKAYLDSLACICETGAAWISGCDYASLFIPPLSFSDERFRQAPIKQNKLNIVLNGDEFCKENIIELGKAIQKTFGLNGDTKLIEHLSETFISEIDAALKASNISEAKNTEQAQ